MTDRVRAWLATWGPILPLLLAEGTIWLGFGALLPVLPIYFVAHGVDLPTLGVVVAASGRSSTAQGLAGAAGTAGTIVASLLAGSLAGIDLRYPFFAVAIGTFAALGLGLLLGRSALWNALQPHARPAAATAVAAEPAPGGAGA